MDVRPSTAPAPDVLGAPAHPPLLEYGRGPVPLRRRARRLMPLVVLIGALLMGGAEARRHAELLSLQRYCARYAVPADEVVYEARLEVVSDPHRPEALAELVELPNSTHPTPGPWQELARWAGEKPLLDAGPVLFLHERRSARGERRVVCVEYAGAWNPLIARTVKPGTPLSRPIFEPIQYSPAINLTNCHRLRFFAGQPDPADDSRFTIGYEMDGRVGTLEGQLLEDGDIALRVLDGPAAAAAGPVGYL